MSLTYSQAVDAVLTTFRAAWLPTTYDAFYDDTAQDRGTDEDPWARATVIHADGFQATLRNGAGQATYRRIGVLTVQIFVASGSGLQTGYDLVKIVSDAFEGQSVGGLWFRDVRVREIGRDGAFRQTNVIAEFEYDEVK
jgi:hypothetical protein